MPESFKAHNKSCAPFTFGSPSGSLPPLFDLLIQRCVYFYHTGLKLSRPITDPIAQTGIDILRKYAEVDMRRGLTAEELQSVIGEYEALRYLVVISGR